MDQFIMDIDGINCLVSQLGCTMEGTFYISEECEETLEQLISSVEREGPHQTNTRQRLGMLELVTKSLIPLISALGTEQSEEVDAKVIFNLATRLLMYLTQPSESICIPPGKIAMCAPEDHDAEMQEYLWQYKNCFLEKNTLPTFFTHIQAILDEAKDGQLTTKDCETVNVFLLVIRNIIFSSPQEVFDSKYADILLLRLLFQAGLEDMIVQLVLMEQHVVWCAAIVQILSVIYKNRVPTEVKEFKSSSLGRTWVQTNVKSNCRTEKKFKPDRGYMSQVKEETTLYGGSATSTVSDSSESWHKCINEEHTDSQNGGSSCGDEADCSYSSEDKLDEGVEASLMQIEAKLCLTLNDFRVRQEQQMFTCTMLSQNVFNRLIEALNDNLMFKKNALPDVYFMWLIVHFLRVAQQGDVHFDKIKSCLTVDMVSYLTYAGVSSMEELTVAGEVTSDSAIFSLRRYHLALLAIQEVINTIHYVRLQDKSPKVRACIAQLTEFLLNMRDLRSLLLLTIRRYRPIDGNNLFLRDAVALNHNFLSLAEPMSSRSGQIKNNFNMLEHVRGFATTEVMAQYGSLLEDYHSNSPLLNDCIFTMMHHVAGDCGAPQTLMQLPILSAFSDIWDDIHDLPQECQDLIHFTLDNFLTQAEGNPYECAEQLYGDILPHEMDALDGPTTRIEDRESLMTEYPSSDKTGWTEEERVDLFMIYQDFVDEPLKSSSGQITMALKDKGIIKSEKEVLLQLYELNLNSEQEILDYTMGPGYCAERGMDCDNTKYCPQEQPMVQDGNNAIRTFMAPEYANDLPAKDVELFVHVLIEHGYSKMLSWVQMVLLETCYVKLGGRRISNGRYPEEAVPLHYTLRNKSVPLVTYTERQEEMLHDRVFMFLMEKLGLHFPSDTVKSYPCIPNFWTPADILNAAKKLGHIKFEEQKFCESQVTDSINEHLANIHKALILYSSVEQAPTENREQMGSLWNTFIQQCNVNLRQNNTAKFHTRIGVSYMVEATTVRNHPRELQEPRELRGKHHITLSNGSCVNA